MKGLTTITFVQRHTTTGFGTEVSRCRGVELGIAGTPPPRKQATPEDRAVVAFTGPSFGVDSQLPVQAAMRQVVEKVLGLVPWGVRGFYHAGLKGLSRHIGFRIYVGLGRGFLQIHAGLTLIRIRRSSKVRHQRHIRQYTGNYSFVNATCGYKASDGNLSLRDQGRANPEMGLF